MDRGQLVQWLTTNCECWKGKEKVLGNVEAFADSDLEKLKSNAELATLTVNALKDIGAAIKAPKNAQVSDLVKLVKNEFPPKKKDEEEEEEDEEDEDMKKNVASYLGGLSEADRLALLAPPGSTLNEYVTTSKEIHEREKMNVIAKLTANIANPEDRKKHILKLRNKKLSELNDLLELLPTGTSTVTKNEDDAYLDRFFGAQGGVERPTANAATVNKDDVLVPAINIFDDEEVVS